MRKFLFLLFLISIPALSYSQGKEDKKDDFLEVTEYEVRWIRSNDEQASYGQVILLLKKGPLVVMNASNPELIKLWVDMLRNEKPVFYSRDTKQLWASPITSPTKKE